MKKIFVILSLLFIIACDKDPSEITIHCDGLVNQIPPQTDNGRLFIVTAFTPNGDGRNDMYHVFGQNLSSVSVKIYDDKGNLITTITQLNTPWSAPVITSGVREYLYRAEAVTQQGTKLGQCGKLYAIACAPNNYNLLNFEDELTPNGFTGVTSEQLQVCN